MASFFKTEERSLQLEEYHKQPILWGLKNEDYLRKPKRLDVWCEIASMFEFKDAEEGLKVRDSRMVNLLSAFYHKTAKERKSKGDTGKGNSYSFQTVQRIQRMPFGHTDRILSK